MRGLSEHDDDFHNMTGALHARQNEISLVVVGPGLGYDANNLRTNHTNLNTNLQRLQPCYLRRRELQCIH